MLSSSYVEVIYLHIQRVVFTFICGGYVFAYSKSFDVAFALKNDYCDSMVRK